jgi:hypothetical protein
LAAKWSPGSIDLAVIKEVEGAVSGRYPPEWPEVARRIKEEAGWLCERCKHPHDTVNGFTLTVHHLDGNKWNLARWNLSALCQRCHLHIQNKVDWFQDSLDGRHASWLAPHIQGYNEWAEMLGKPLLKLGEIYTRSYENEWPEYGSS